MGLTYRAIRGVGLTVSVLDGEISQAEYLEYARRQNADRDWHATTRSLIDARTVLTPPGAEQVLASISATYEQMRADDAPSRTAIVAGHDFALASQYGETRTEAGTLTIAFHDLSTACIWLDVELELVQQTIGELREELTGAAPNQRG